MPNPEFVQIVGDSIGIDLPNATARVMSSHLNDMLGQVIQIAKEFSAQSHRGNVLQKSDVVSALRLLREDTNCNLPFQNPVKVFQQDTEHPELFRVVDGPLSVQQIIDKGVQNIAPPEPNLVVHWLVVNGVQPQIPLNPSLDEIQQLQPLTGTLPSSVADSLITLHRQKQDITQAADITAFTSNIATQTAPQELITAQKRTANDKIVSREDQPSSEDTSKGTRQDPMVEFINQTKFQADVIPGAGALAASNAMLLSSINQITSAVSSSVVSPFVDSTSVSSALTTASSGAISNPFSSLVPQIPLHSSVSAAPMISDQPDRLLLDDFLTDAQKEFFSYSTELILGNDQTLATAALDSISTPSSSHSSVALNPFLSSSDVSQNVGFKALSSCSQTDTLTPFYTQFFCRTALRNITNATILSRLLRLGARLVSSESLSVEGQLQHLLVAVLSLCLASNVGLSERVLQGGTASDFQPQVRDLAAIVLRIMLCRFRGLYPSLLPRTLKTLVETASDGSKALSTRAGALMTLTTLGPIVTGEVVLPIIISLSQTLILGKTAGAFLDGAFHYLIDLLRQQTQIRYHKRLIGADDEDIEELSVPLSWLSYTVPYVSGNDLPSLGDPAILMPNILPRRRRCDVDNNDETKDGIENVSMNPSSIGSLLDSNTSQIHIGRQFSQAVATFLKLILQYIQHIQHITFVEEQVARRRILEKQRK